jgi:hypothetical protein
MTETEKSLTPPAAKKIAEPAPLFLPWAIHFPAGLRDEIITEIGAFNPANAEPMHLEIAKAAAKAMIATLPESARGAEVRMECLGGEGKQILVQVSPRLIKKN